MVPRSSKATTVPSGSPGLLALAQPRAMLPFKDLHINMRFVLLSVRRKQTNKKNQTEGAHSSLSLHSTQIETPKFPYWGLESFPAPCDCDFPGHPPSYFDYEIQFQNRITADPDAARQEGEALSPQLDKIL